MASSKRPIGLDTNKIYVNVPGPGQMNSIILVPSLAACYIGQVYEEKWSFC